MARIKTLTEAEILNGITDEMAREEGYPDAETLRMESQLGKLAGKWRRTQAPNIIADYHNLFHRLVHRGWNPNLLTAQQALPDALMPTPVKDKR